MQQGFWLWLSEMTRRNTLLAILVILIALLSGLWALQNVQETVRTARESLFTSIVATQAEALTVWATERQADTRRWANDPAIARFAGSLVADRGELETDAGKRGEARAGFAERIAPAIEDLRLAAANIVSLQGRLLASLQTEYVGATLTPDFRAELANAFSGSDVFIGPTPERDRLLDWKGERPEPSIVWTASPIRDPAGEVLAVLCLGRHATGRFARILAAGHSGDSGETYAFDRDGVLVSPTRREAALREAGLIGRDESLLPGTFKLREFREGIGLSPTTPLTRLVGQALERGASVGADSGGTILVPYPGYAGKNVLGAWRWIAELNLGIAFEMEAGEALAPGRYVTTNIVVLVVTVVLTLTLGPLLPPLLWRRFLPIAVGDRIGSYRILRKLGEGGLAEVFEARHDGLGKQVALKISKGGAREDFDLRLEREARLLAQFSHPGVVEVFDCGRHADGRPYYVMQYIDGESLSARAQHDMPMREALVVAVLMQLCEALQSIHERGITHRDIKPDNVMLENITGQADIARIIDFGLAKSLYERDRMQLTRDTSLLGTLGYVAPERIRDPANTDPAGDVYAIGAIGLYLLTGEETSTDLDALDRWPPRVRALLRGIANRDLAKCIEKAIAPRKADRWASCRELRYHLSRVQTDS